MVYIRRCVLCVSLAVLIPTQAFWSILKTGRGHSTELVDYDANTIADNLGTWGSDMAIMFYAPWCNYCKQLTPGWTLIANSLKSGNLQIGKLNCEKNEHNQDLCQRLGIDRYPSVYFFGHSNLNQNLQGLTLPLHLAQMVARYEGELYLDALYDWTWLLGKMSSADRVLNALSNSFLNPFANNRLKQRIKDLEAEILILKADHVTKAEKINEYETIQMFDALNMEGDSFAVMHSEPATDSNLPFRVCVSELAKEYCKYCKDDPYCSDVLQSCANTFFESSSCRPKICPMKDRGCRVVSTCLREGVVDEFQVSINKK